MSLVRKFWRPSAVARRSLLPRWIAFLCWPFLIFVFVPLGLLVPGPVTHTFFSLSHNGSVFAPEALFLQAVMLLYGVAAYGLLWGRSWGLAAGTGAMLVGIAVPFGMSLVGAVDPLPVEFFVQAFLLVSLLRLRTRWANPSTSHAGLPGSAL